MKKKRPAKRIRSFKIENDVWQYVLFVRVGGTREQAESWFDKTFGEPQSLAWLSKCRNATTFYRTDERSHLIWFDAKPGGGIVSHEALHSVQHVLSHSGLGPLSEATEEAYAYLLGWTVMQIGLRLW
ncbi:hypothetical protein EP7_004352 [Isosphaeraceae bacterium EP7]